MPTAEDFEVLAVALDAQADELEVVMQPVWSMFDADVMAGGRLRDDLQQRLDDDAGWLAVDAGLLRDAAATCRERAEVCRLAEAAELAYGVSLTRYQERLAHWEWSTEVGVAAGPRPMRPAPPARPPRWVAF